MKKLFTLLLLAFSSGINAQSLIDTSKTWTVDECFTSWGLSCWPVQYSFQGDTIINSVSYKILSTGSYFLREDTLAKKSICSSERHFPGRAFI